MLDTLIASSLTLFLGPGVGHLFLKQFRKAAFFIVGSLAIVFAFAIYISQYLIKNFPADAAALNIKDSVQFLYNLYSKNPTALIIFEAVFAAFWAYSIVDVMLTARAVKTPEKKDDNPAARPPDNQ